MIVSLSKREIQILLKGLDTLSVTDPEAALLYNKLAKIGGAFDSPK